MLLLILINFDKFIVLTMIGKTINYIKGSLRPVIFFLPLTYYLILFCVGFLLLSQIASQYLGQLSNNYASVFSLLVRTAYFFTIILIGFAFLTAIFSFGLFSYRRQKNKIKAGIQIIEAPNRESEMPLIEVSVSPLIKPLLGFIKIRIQYDDNHYSPKYTLIDTGRKLWSSDFSGRFRWKLQHVKEYRIKEVYIYFEDFFQFFSFTSALKVDRAIQIKPSVKTLPEFTVTPRKTEQTTFRIPDLKKVEGEMLHFKNFEDTDDVRRIVWKIYARNKELVVRTPEVLDPSASHIYICGSFYTAYAITGNKVAEDLFLTHFKNIIFSVLKGAEKQGFNVRYISDQELPVPDSGTKTDELSYPLLSSTWQNQTSPKMITHLKDCAAMIVSSLTDADSIMAILNNKSYKPLIVFVKLSTQITRLPTASLLKRMFVEVEENENTYRKQWYFSTLRRKISENEKEIERVLQDHIEKVTV